jgi:carbon monoxide dehydrogenase subunit G
VWAYLLDVHKVAACTPGFQNLEELGEEHWKAVIAVGVGAVKATFTLDVTRPEKHEHDLMIFKDGQMVGRLMGPPPGRLKNEIDRVLAHSGIAEDQLWG